MLGVISWCCELHVREPGTTGPASPKLKWGHWFTQRLTVNQRLAYGSLLKKSSMNLAPFALPAGLG